MSEPPFILMVAGRRFRDSSDNFIVELSMKSVKDGIKG
jgi:hypothetical protein